MACARCDFYIPKPSSKAQLLETKTNIDRRLALIPLTDGELAAVEQDRKAVGRLLEAWLTHQLHQVKRPEKSPAHLTLSIQVTPLNDHSLVRLKRPFLGADLRQGYAGSAGRVKGAQRDRSHAQRKRAWRGPTL
jgi:hypothetical protein